MTARWRILAGCSGAIVSGLLLAASFPPLERCECAWIALVPLLLVARFFRPAIAFRLGLLGGAVFWTLNLAWLAALSRNGVPIAAAAAGWLILAAYSAFYVAAFAMLASRWFQSVGSVNWKGNLCFLAVAPIAWVGLEYIRTHILTGFPWNLLGTSQYSMLPIIQVAELGGVYAVSALLVLFNAVIVLSILNFRGTAIGKYRFHIELMAGLIVLGLVLSFGMRRIGEVDREKGEELTISVIQPAIPQTEKWSIELIEKICDRLWDLTSGAAIGAPDLIVWPETAMPGDVLWYPECKALADALLTNGVPLLIGSTDTRADGESYRYYNSSMLFEPDGSAPAIYYKQHLAPFGEYDPTHVLPMRFLAPEGWCALTPGKESTIFRLKKHPDAAFAALICFEDSFPALARKAVRKGARLLINQTNDAWFDGSCGPKQHMAQYIFRCVENRVPGVRAANTGISCFIDRTGRVVSILKDPETGDYSVDGFWPSDVTVPPQTMPLTFYTRHGDTANAAAAVATVILLLLTIRGLNTQALRDHPQVAK